MLPDDPIIRCMEATGYPPWIDPNGDNDPICPMCGEICDTVYKNKYGEIVGCGECVTSHDAWEEDECCPWRDEE